MIRIEMLPAERGDALLVEYGPGDDLRHRVLVDGGPVNSDVYEPIRRRLLDVRPDADGRRHFDLLVVTHVDTDHIEGAIRLLQDDELRCVFDDVWYNGWRQIAEVDATAEVRRLGPKQGEFFGALLVRQGRPWNQYVRGGPIVVPDDGALPRIELRGGMALTILSPTVAKVEQLAAEWETVIRAAGWEPGDLATAYEQFEGEWWAQGPPTLGGEDRIAASLDNTAANGSSIAVLAEYGGRAALLAADAHDDALTASLRRLRAERGLAGPLPLDALKLSHHGSKHNTTPQLLAEVACPTYLVSSSGDRFHHPDARAISTVIAHHRAPGRPTLLCNYDQPETAIWRGHAQVDARYGPDAVLVLDT
jgi:hypothetical protein